MKQYVAKNKDRQIKVPLFFISRKSQTTLERQILNTTLFMFATVLLISNGINILSGCPVELIIVQFLESTLLATLFFLSGFKKNLRKIKTVFFCL